MSNIETPSHHLRFEKGTLLGDFLLSPQAFYGLDNIFQEFQTEEFSLLNDKQKGDKVNRVLVILIQKCAAPCFLLSAVINYIDRVNELCILEHYTFSMFELWLNQFSDLSYEENYQIRAKIMGKWVPRETYQVIFPIGMEKIYSGSHFVTAHSSPDLDTTVASFWGWVDAFATRVCEGLHLWNVPGGPPLSQIEISLLFKGIFGNSIFTHIVKSRASLALSGFDLLSQRGVLKKLPQDSTFTIDHERNQNAVMLVDQKGYFLGDWHNIDVEGVRQVIMLLNHCLRWFEIHLNIKLVSLFAKEKLTLSDLEEFANTVFKMRIQDVDPFNEFTARQKRYVQDYLVKVLGVKQGIASTFEEFAKAMKELSLFEFQEFVELVESLKKSHLFDQSGILIESRPHIFHFLEQIIKGLNQAIQSVRSYVERLDVCLKIKTQVFGYAPQVISYRAEVEEIRSKISNYPYVTVTYSDRAGRMIPLGVVHSGELHRPILGTVTLRDFCNREETKIPSYLEVISVIDHHKSSLGTTSAPTALISDAQSSNALVAELAFHINDQFSDGGMTLQKIKDQMTVVSKDLSSTKNKRLLKRLLQRQIAIENKHSFFISKEREFIEYLHFLFAILEDTDLLTKVSRRDVECVASLINRLKSLAIGEEVEVISFDDLPKDKNFVLSAAKRILQNVDMYSLYRKIYLSKETAIEDNIFLCVQGKPNNMFADTKEQNACCRVGQTKIFSGNYATFSKHAPLIRKAWLEEALQFNKEKNEVDLHLHMISTIAGADELYQGNEGDYKHQDELWIWIPSTEPAVEHLKSFLNAFRSSPNVINNRMEVAFLGKNAKELDQIFTESFLPIPRKSISTESLPIAILYYRAGSINSRKAMISPYLPRLTS